MRDILTLPTTRPQGGGTYAKKQQIGTPIFKVFLATCTGNVNDKKRVFLKKNKQGGGFLRERGGGRATEGGGVCVKWE